jgi:modulator of FtsH protease
MDILHLRLVMPVLCHAPSPARPKRDRVRAACQDLGTMTAYDVTRWSDFAIAQLGASAALLGLVFVGLSINLRDFVGTGALVHRAAEAVIVLGSVLVAATAVVIPDQSDTAVGVELLVVALTTLAVVISLQRDASEHGSDRPGPPFLAIAIRHVLGLGAPLLLGIAAVTLLTGVGGGLYWGPVAIVAAYMCALSDAWVLLIEILR